MGGIWEGQPTSRFAKMVEEKKFSHPLTFPSERKFFKQVSGGVIDFSLPPVVANILLANFDHHTPRKFTT